MTRSPKRHLAAASLAAMSLLLAMLAGAGASAQSTDTTIVFRSWACPDGVPSNEWEECDAVIGATYRVEADGVEVATSPVTTVRDMGIGSGAELRVPADATTVTVTQLSGGPDGYVPAPGSDPFSATIADLPQVGFGGESTGPGIAFVNIPADAGAGDEGTSTGDNDAVSGDEDAATGDSGAVSTLPTTGTGAMAADAAQQPGAIGLLLAAAALVGAGCLTRRVRPT